MKLALISLLAVAPAFAADAPKVEAPKAAPKTDTVFPRWSQCSATCVITNASTASPGEAGRR